MVKIEFKTSVNELYIFQYIFQNEDRFEVHLEKAVLATFPTVDEAIAYARGMTYMFGKIFNQLLNDVWGVQE